MPATSLYAAILGLLFVVLSVRTLRIRRRLSIGIGDAANPEMLRASRVHANFAEYVPISLLLLFFVETTGMSLLVHILGISLIVGRASHAYGVSQAQENYAYRVFGMAATLGTLVIASAYLLYFYATQVGA